MRWITMAFMLNQNGGKQRFSSIYTGLYVVLIGISLLLGGCSLLPASKKEQAQASHERVLPIGWEAISDWQPVNLDDDQDTENLLLFSFDNGQVGALILEGDPATSISTPTYLLPRYFDNEQALGQGIIAPPGTPAGEITVTQVKGDKPTVELTILGATTHLTFAWWEGDSYGYGVTQLYAPGGFGVDWDTWRKDPKPVVSVVGYYPMQDYRARSNICNLVLYTRRNDLQGSLPSIIFTGEDQGLNFCNSKIPVYPYAPEGVVLAYLLSPRSGELAPDELLTPGTSVEQLDAQSAYERLPTERIDDIAAYPSALIEQGQPEAGLTTSVCVELAEKANPSLRRWLVYTLRYEPADMSKSLPERWTVSGAFTEPPPVDPPQHGYCEVVLGRNVP
jgi:hypothetical protein